MLANIPEDGSFAGSLLLSCNWTPGKEGFFPSRVTISFSVSLYCLKTCIIMTTVLTWVPGL